jgi:hypothetical protein
MGDQDQTVYYRLPRSVVRIEGTVTVATGASGASVATQTGEASLATEADPDARYELLLEDEWWKEREFSLKLASDERLLGAGDTTTGLGAEVVGAGVRIATLALKLAPAFLLAEEPEPVEDVFRREQPELAVRRRVLRESAAALQAALGPAAGELARGAGDPTVAERVKSLSSALAAVRGEAALLEAAFDAWFADRFPEAITDYLYTVSTDQLPALEEPQLEAWFPHDDLRGQAREAAETVGVIVARIGDRDPTPHSEPEEDVYGIRFRFPRLLRLGVYGIEEDGGEMLVLGEEGLDRSGPAYHARLRRVLPAWVVDQNSKVGVMQIKAGLFEKHSATAEFGDAGTLTAFSNKRIGAAAAVSKAVGAAGGQVQESLDQAAKIKAAFPAPADPKLRALQQQVEHKELKARLAKAEATIAGGGNTSGSGG